MGMGFGKYGDRILEPIEVKYQDTTFSLGFKPTRKNIIMMIAQQREKR